MVTRQQMRVCAEPGCPRLQRARRCAEHERQRERVRGSSSQRGYGQEHSKLRDSINRRGIENFVCARCGGAFMAGEEFQLGHTDDRASWHGPEHARCNLSAAGRASGLRTFER